MNVIRLLKLCSAFFKKSEETFDPRKERPIDPSLLEKEIVDIVKEYDYDEDDNLSTINKMYSGHIEYDHTADVKIQELYKKICDVWPEYNRKLDDANNYIESHEIDHRVNPRIKEKEDDIENLFKDNNYHFDGSQAKKIASYIAEWYADVWAKYKAAKTIVDYKVNFSCNPNFMSTLNEKKDKKFIAEWLAEIFNSILYSLRVNENSFKTGKQIILFNFTEIFFENLSDRHKYEIDDDADEDAHKNTMRYFYNRDMKFMLEYPKYINSLRSLLEYTGTVSNALFRSVQEQPFTGKDPLSDSFNEKAIKMFKETFGENNIADKFFKEFLKSDNKYEIINIIGRYTGYNTRIDYIIKVLEESNLLNLNSFIILTRWFNKQTLTVGLEVNATLDIINYLTSNSIKILKSQTTLVNDLEIFFKLMEIFHNNMKDVKSNDTINLWKAVYDNANLKNINTDIIEKFIKIIIVIYSFEKNDKSNIVKACIKNKLISSNFYENIESIKSIFEKNIKLQINDANLKNIINTVMTETEIVLNSETIIKYNEQAKPKNEKLFELDSEITNGSSTLRFRVLKDKDPYHFTVGLDTDCCQRIGGAGEAAAIDSYINAQAGVLLLELNSDNEWDIISQSYFHYVPKDNGIILDNVESNEQNVKKFKVDINKIYSDYAIDMKNKLKLAYFKCGKAYNALDNSLFESSKMKSDPRNFDVDDPYSDFDEDDHIDLAKKAT